MVFLFFIGANLKQVLTDLKAIAATPIKPFQATDTAQSGSSGDISDSDLPSLVNRLMGKRKYQRLILRSPHIVPLIRLCSVPGHLTGGGLLAAKLNGLTHCGLEIYYIDYVFVCLPLIYLGFVWREDGCVCLERYMPAVLMLLRSW